MTPKEEKDETPIKALSCGVNRTPRQLAMASLEGQLGLGAIPYCECKTLQDQL